ncbi:hypothetical protein NC651_034414 [Populus alba x Populus x berolinensis]|nr:hypothetical protein NC651_034414 [Populus alba x Populus x berolinensis]
MQSEEFRPERWLQGGVSNLLHFIRSWLLFSSTSLGSNLGMRRRKSNIVQCLHFTWRIKGYISMHFTGCKTRV